MKKINVNMPLTPLPILVAFRREIGLQGKLLRAFIMSEREEEREWVEDRINTQNKNGIRAEQNSRTHRGRVD